MSSPVRREQRGRVQPAGLLERALGDPEHVGQRQDHVPGHGRARRAADRSGRRPRRSRPCRRSRTRRSRRSGARRPADVVERAGQADEDRVVGLAERGRVAALGPDDLRTVDESLGPQEPDRELRLVTGRPHRDRDRDRLLPRTGRPDLQRAPRRRSGRRGPPGRRRGRPRSDGSRRGGSGRHGASPRPGMRLASSGTGEVRAARRVPCRRPRRGRPGPSRRRGRRHRPSRSPGPPPSRRPPASSPLRRGRRA